jgi:hypothetical protein
MFSSSGTLLRNRSFDPNPGYALGLRIKNQASGQRWGRGGGVFGGSNHVFLLTISLADDATFGDISDYYTYSSVTPSGFTARRCDDVRLLPSGNLFMLATYNGPSAPKYHCLELSPSGSSLVRVAAFEDAGGSEQFFSFATPYSDGSIVLSSSSPRHLKIDSNFNQVWYKQARVNVGNEMYPVLDASQNMYLACRGALGDFSEPTGWTAANGVNWASGSIGKIDAGFTALAYSTWSDCGQGSAAFSYLGTNSGIDLANGRFIGCAENGNNVISHKIEMPTTVTALALSGGQVAKAGTGILLAAAGIAALILLPRFVRPRRSAN